jgi:hypothetical protein
MIELKDDRLVFCFPDVHPDARLNIDFQRTLRIPDDGKTYPLPPGLGRFPVRHVDDFSGNVPFRWLEHGGVMLPMYQSEALWLYFLSDFLPGRRTCYPFAVKVATGKIDALTGQTWSQGLHAGPQDYMVAPEQPWLDGYCVEKGSIRQFVAMPLGAGYSAEEQITHEAQHGGLQIAVYPMKREVFERRFPKANEKLLAGEALFRKSMAVESVDSCLMDMGLAPGGLMKQEIYQDPFGLDDWDQTQCSRCFVHIANSLVWRAVTGEQPPTTPFTAREYTDAGLPWFDYYNDTPALEGSSILAQLKSVLALGKDKGQVPLPENASTDPGLVKLLGKKKDQVREGVF